MRTDAPGLSPRRIGAAVAAGVWATLFWFLMASGRTSLYLSPRTAWVVPTGAILLTAVVIGRVLTARAHGPEPIPRRTAWGLGVVVLPAVLILAVPPSALGSYAASRRSLAAGVVGGPTDTAVGERVTLADVAAGVWSGDARRTLADRAGSRVTFEGIVIRREDQSADEFVLTRFIVSCCVADALSVQVRVVGAPPGRFPQDQWVRVTGTFYPVGRETVVDASSVTAIARPDQPYLSV
jgi:uncharacterized repeat protein (TIGR03943 family)